MIILEIFVSVVMLSCCGVQVGGSRHMTKVKHGTGGSLMYDLPSRDSEQCIKRKEYGAWQECGECKGTGKESYLGRGRLSYGNPCPKCQGAGGWWHEKVRFGMPGCGSDTLYTKPHLVGIGPVTRSSILVQSGEACEKCKGRGRKYGTVAPERSRMQGKSIESTIKSCPDCNGTGINPETERWEVE